MKTSQVNPAYVKYILSLLLFGTNGIVASRIDLTSYEIVLLRSMIGSIMLIAIYLLTGGKFSFWHNKRQSLYVAVSGIAMGASWMFLYEGYQQIGVGLASLAYYCGPVIVMVLSPVLFQERLTGPKICGFLALIVGIFLVNGQAMQVGKSGWGIFCGAMSAVMFAIMVIFTKKAKDIKGVENSMLQVSFSFLTVAVFAGIKQGFSLHISGGDWLPVLMLGLINTGIGCYFYFSSIGRLPVQTVAICGYLEPLAAVIFSALFLKETMLPLQVFGAVLILGGAFFGEIVGNHTTETSTRFKGIKLTGLIVKKHT